MLGLHPALDLSTANIHTKLRDSTIHRDKKTNTKGWEEGSSGFQSDNCKATYLREGFIFANSRILDPS